MIAWRCLTGAGLRVPAGSPTNAEAKMHFVEKQKTWVFARWVRCGGRHWREDRIMRVDARRTSEACSLSVAMVTAPAMPRYPRSRVVTGGHRVRSRHKEYLF